jgi:glycerol 3-phosphatase-2
VRRPIVDGCATPLTSAYDTGLFDLDGVLYLQEEPIDNAPDGVRAARSAGMRIGFVTNNASRHAPEVAALLRKVGVEADPDEVVTAAQTAARRLADRLPTGARVLVVGSDALGAELADVGLTPVRSADEQPVAVVQGYAKDVGWTQLSEASVAIRAGAYWLATNADSTFPSSRGPLPGNGAMIAALATALRRGPDEIVGKPHPQLHRESVVRTGARNPLVVGDRLDTDIAGAIAGDADSLLVLTGVTTAAELLAAGRDERPTYVADDLLGLTVSHPPVEQNGTGRDGTASCEGWFVRVTDGQLVLSGRGERLDALRTLAVVAWGLADADGSSDPAGATPDRTSDGAEAAAVLEELGL